MTNLNNKSYLQLMIILLPLINFISGLSIDLYAPSMPQIAEHFNVNKIAIQNTVTISVMGWSIGAIVWGTLFDMYGRRKIVISMLILFVISSILAIFSQNILQLLIIRFIQGVAVAAMSVGSRVLVVDHFTGHKLNVAVIYTSVAYAMGTILGPFIGGYLQFHFGWKSNFGALAVIGGIIAIFVYYYVEEQFTNYKKLSIKSTLLTYKIVLSNFTFISGCIIAGIIQIEMMFYPTFCSFIVENHLHYSSIVYGNTAMIISLAYLLGSLVNRSLLSRLMQKTLIAYGITILMIGLFWGIIFILYFNLNLFTLVLPILIIYIANGFIFGNIMTNCLKMFKDNVGVATASIVCMLMLFGAIGTFIISLFIINSLAKVIIIFIILTIIKTIAYKKYFIRIFNN